MLVTINIPTSLRRFTDNRSTFVNDASTLAEALDGLVLIYPRLYAQIFSDDGELRRFIKIFINKKAVDTMPAHQVSLSGGDEVTLIPAMAGG